MSDIPPWAYRGAFIPFHLPVPPPGVDPLSSGDTGLCWADEWTPAILGALKTLTRPETWTGTEAEIAAAIQGAQDLIGNLDDGCGSGSGFPFICFADYTLSAAPFATVSVDSGCGEWADSLGYRGSLCGPFGGHYFFGAQIDITFDSPITLTGLNMTYSWAGGDWVTGHDDYVIFFADVTHGTILRHIDYTHAIDAEGQVLNWSGSVAGVEEISCAVYSSKRSVSTGTDGIDYIQNLSISGNGPSPCGSE